MGFTKDSTADEVLDGLDISGRKFVITGAASGLGEESARALAARGAHVTMLARNPERNTEAANRIRAAVPKADLELGEVDLADLSSIRQFATSYLQNHSTIDVLMNNAGVMACPLQHTADGFEMQFGTNHLGHFLLTALLSPALLASDGPRVVNLTSAGHAISDVDLDDPNFEHTDYHPWMAYGRSKTANVLFTKELARRLGPTGLLAFAVHPGTIQTNLDRHLEEGKLASMMERNKQRSEAAGESTEGADFKPVGVGAATQVWAATANELAEHNGAYLGACRLGELGGPTQSYGYLPYVDNADNAQRLWTLSEELVGQRFDT